MDVRNRELNTVAKVVTSETAGIVAGGQVPAGMKRWVTFMTLDTMQVSGGASQVKLYVASVATNNPTKASLVATSNRKMMIALRATGVDGLRKAPVTVPERPSVKTPLFSIAGGNYLGFYASKTTANVVFQYFDE